MSEAGYLELISVIGHELRRPLTVIRGVATLMLDMEVPSKECRGEG